jgi:hypothetical protein
MRQFECALAALAPTGGVFRSGLRVCIGNRHVKEDVFVVLSHIGSIRGGAAHEDVYIARQVMMGG